MSVLELLEEIRALSLEERKQLMKLMVDTLAEPAEPSKKHHSLRELRGLGKEIWEGIDAQEYVNKLRDEWDTR
ncbi:MAG: hypothetical protein HZC41_20515 [Chloroflexi bacterium]|nr:hypothetical protein [Chloroflexota bacterium]